MPRVFKAQLGVGLKAYLADDFDILPCVRQQHRAFRAANVQSQHAHSINTSRFLSKSQFFSGYHSAHALSTDGFSDKFCEN